MSHIDTRTYEDGQLIAMVKKGETDHYRIRLCSYRGNQYLDVRVWYFNKEGEGPLPGKGVTLKLTALPEIITALQKAAQRVKGSG